jgi:hypothetical protein
VRAAGLSSYLPRVAAGDATERIDALRAHNFLRRIVMSKIRTMLIGAALTAFATSAAFAQTGAATQGTAGAGVQTQTPAAGAGAGAGMQGGAGANASGNAVGGATDAVGTAADGATDTAASSVHSAKKHAKHAMKSAKHHASSAKPKSKVGDEAVEGGASTGVQGGASASGATQ